MPAYQVALIKVTNRTPGFLEYVERSAEILAKHGAEYVVRGPAKTVLEGDCLEGRAVVISKWPSLEAIDEFYYSDDYQQIKPLREGSGVYDIAAYEAAS